METWSLICAFAALCRRRANRASSCLLLGAAALSAQRHSDFQIPKPLPPNSVIVIGFLGGFERWNDPHRGVRKVALDIRQRNLTNVYAETFENRRRSRALKFIKRSTSKVQGVRIILYGQSLGGSAAINVARELGRVGQEVRLTVQVDSVGLHDMVIPPNVAAAANLYQHDAFTIAGKEEIRAADPQRTRILENTRLTYFFRPFDTVSKDDASWIRRTLGGSHAKMEADEAVWRHVEDLILAAIQ